MDSRSQSSRGNKNYLQYDDVKSRLSYRSRGQSLFNREQTEMQVLQSYGGQKVRQHHVEEPSLHGSFMEEHNEKVVIVEELSQQARLIKMVVAMVSFGVMTFIAKVMQKNFRHTIWEDLYGRGVVFLICAIVHYLRQTNIISLFDIRPQIRLSFFFRVIFICLAYIFYFLAVFNTSSFVYVGLILCLLPLVCKVVQRNAMIEAQFSYLDILCLIISLVGLVLLYRGNGNFTSDLTQQFDNQMAFVYGVLCIVTWSIANYILHRNSIYVHHTIDTLYVSLFNTIIVPSFIIIYFSFHPTNLTYEWEQFAYFAASGFLTWLFHSQFTEVIKEDLHNIYLGIIYAYLFVCFFTDSVFYHEIITLSQAIAFILIVAPNCIIFMLRWIGFIAM